MKRKFHCCATCTHFLPIKEEKGTRYTCKRLGYDTKPTYQFNCWNPKPHVKKLMEKEK
ncbi:hypothetical protein HNQ94_000758 [Salirhabdus euzebyi]|uniref:Uncharacterized protein n=1 Tax=Salirhabdus euzebyi TaxID=394506 RepID=A0A841Q1R6_9BACI|nr:hypothetical protein [Salirhabdus euzebyi]